MSGGHPGGRQEGSQRSESASGPASILLAEDETLVRQGVKMMIETAPDLCVTAEAADGRGAVEWCAKRAFDLVILDIRMPEMDGVAAAQRILAREPDQKVLFLTTFNDVDYALQALRLGVRGYLLKNADAGRLIASIRSVLAGGLSLEDQVAAKVVPRLLRAQGAQARGAGGGAASGGPGAAHEASSEALTDRETSVVRLVGQGLSNDEISAALGISTGTVKNVVSAALDKLHLRDRTQLAIHAIRNGLV